MNPITWLKNYNNYRDLVALYPAGRDDDRTNGESIKMLRENFPVPLYSPASEAAPFQDSLRTPKQVGSDLLIESVLLTSLKLTGAAGKMAALTKTGHVAGNDDNSVIAVYDKYEDRTRAFVRLVQEQDVETKASPNPNATGFMAGAFAEAKVDRSLTPEAFIQKKGQVGARLNLEMAAPVRALFQGYEFNREGSTTAGALDRGEVPPQLSRVKTFLVRVQDEMKRMDFPEGTKIATTGHSLGTGTALSARMHLNNDEGLSRYPAGHATLIEPVAAAISARQVAVLAAVAKIAGGKETTVQTELAALTQGVDVLSLQGGALGQFAVHNAPDNSRLVGEREFQLPVQAKVAFKALQRPVNTVANLKAHTIAGLAMEFLTREPEGLLVEIGNANMLPPARAALEPAQHPSVLTDDIIRNAAHGMLAILQNGKTPKGNEPYLSHTIKDIGESLQTPKGGIRKIIEAAQLPKPVPPEARGR